MVKIDPTNRHDIHAVVTEIPNCRPCSLQSSSKNVSIFDERHEQSMCRNCRSLAKVNRGAGYGLEVPRVYCLYGPRSWLSLFLLMDIIISVIVTLLNDNGIFH